MDRSPKQGFERESRSNASDSFSESDQEGRNRGHLWLRYQLRLWLLGNLKFAL